MAAKRNKKPVDDLVAQVDPRAPLDGTLLLSKAQGLLAELEADLLARARGSVPVREAFRLRHETERAARRTADPLEIWERHFVTQVAASWVLSCVFVRTLEDRGLLGHNRIAGPGAADSQRLFFEIAPSLTEREYLLTVFRELTRLPAARDLFDARHNPVWLLGPSAALAKKLVALFRAPNADAPGLRFGQADTRFLGDLYQDLSADVRERFALLQTPHFVEKYILDRTLERAIARFGLDETTLIDPTCGSGHFLLGAFERLVDHRLRKEPGLEVREAARKALDAVFGADINPYAIAIARFRLTLAFLEKGGYPRLADAPALPLHLVVADSLLHNPQHAQTKIGELPGQSMRAWSGDEFALEDEDAARDVLHRRFAAVVGNPPYITVKDPVLRERYRELYPRSAAGKYSVAAPFTERFFLLAKSAGFVGMITANSFMKREFGKKLIEGFLPTVNLDGVVNTSGAYIPGHGTPTVLLFGTNETKRGVDVLTVLAKRGEPSTPEDPEHGLVWRSIVEHGGEVGFENDFLSVARVPRTTLERHPWSLGGGGAAELKELLEERSECRLTDLVDDIGFASFTGLDEAFIMPSSAGARLGIATALLRPMVIGEDIRDWAAAESESALTPYDVSSQLPLAYKPRERWGQFLWRYRANLEGVLSFGGKTRKQSGDSWWLWYRWQPDRYKAPFRIAFAFVATHNHFVLDRGGKVFKQSAPIIKLKEGATEEDHLALLAYLNSSTACFYCRQVLHSKGAQGVNEGHKAEEWEQFLEFSGTQVAKVPLPPNWQALAPLGKDMTALASARSRESPSHVVSQASSGGTPLNDDDVRGAARRERAVLNRMVALQERIDFEVYRLFGLITSTPAAQTNLAPGWRPFETQLIRDAAPTAWFTRHGYEIPGATAPALDDLQLPPEVRLIEQPTFKRRWLLSDAQRSLEDAVYAELQALIEAQLRVSSEVLGLKELERRARTTAILSVGRLAMGEDCDPRDFVMDLMTREAVPFVSAHRHTESGLEKRTEWERVWELQRAEDRGEKVPAFDPPPKYDQTDYRDATCWRLRGKLDVPKERFISYPGCESGEDKEPVYGWAGWNHLQQAQALAALYQKRKTDESWGKERLTPMLAGLLELIPWVKQWHNEPSAEFGGLRLGDYFETFLDGECHTLGLTREELRAWRPAERRRGEVRRRAAKAAREVAPDEAGTGLGPLTNEKREKSKGASTPPVERG